MFGNPRAVKHGFAKKDVKSRLVTVATVVGPGDRYRHIALTTRSSSEDDGPQGNGS